MTRRDGRIPLFTRLLTAAATGEDGAPFAEVLGRARQAEAAGIDALLLHDRQSAAPDPADAPHFESGTLTAALAARTRGIGLVTTICTEQALPYHAARVLATADHLTHGRAGWQPLTHADPAAADNYTRAGSASAAERRARAAEFTEVLTGLWDSFDDDAFVRDRASAAYFVPEKLHTLDHKGDHFDVAGPLNIARPPQGHLPLVHRVADADDLALAARIADVVLAPADSGPAVRRTVRDLARQAGRDPDTLVVLLDRPVGDTPGTAAELRALVDTGAADGFTLIAPPGPADAAHEAVLALAAEVRAAAPPSAPAPTLRARLGLPRPAGRYRSAPAAGAALA
ncbi:LLM class flavin-dependent oxidoreductase [Streptomyces sp. NRRL S-118]|uniref:LLM class flavin-dependent oxidoreductase n=1 Tax=Streptomyces sp. NRRL S-118 TaxID=1463881 RepID=UPI0006946773|nr:LLM class flavin-dependent oxidoreductase [Streptomyces sp. NRRL S-118]